MAAFPSSSIAIIGLSGRFPDAPKLEAFWRNLEQGVESLSDLSDADLLASGIPEAVLKNPNYVKKGTLLQGADLFDAEFFGYSPREAEIIDPQQRIFLECAWEALEDAGYADEPNSKTIGVYAGSSTGTYAFSNVLRNRTVLEAAGGYQVLIANDKDYLATRVSYKLNLSGPSLTIQTACSTSLVAVHMAGTAILSGQCDMALAGAVSIGFPQKTGYLYSEGMIFSPDGYCRPFDAQGRGIRAGFGAGIVVLKRLDKALEDHDCIRAVIRGSAINNDGGVKMGYTTPSVDGQARVIADALRVAQVNPESISYIEAHGTATPVGDPIEIAALSRVFRASSDRKRFCAIGSVKSNIGHLDAAAGIAGLIKTVLSLEHQRIPPSLNFHQPNPEIDFVHSPFFVNTSLVEWKSTGEPRRAGVSSFGIGGTNAHVVLEEAPRRQAPTTIWPLQLLVLSARSAPALDNQTAQLAEHLAADSSISLAEVCHTAQVGRRRFPHRRMLVCSDREDAIKVLSRSDNRRLTTRFEEAVSRPVVFMFSGQGSQHLGMARWLYETVPVFRSSLDHCAALLRDEIHCDLRNILYSPEAQSSLLAETRLAQPALFAVEYSLSKMWMTWGVQPESMIGHSIGEYVAACLAGVFSLEDGLRLVAARGRLMQEMPVGGMLAVRLSADELQALIRSNLQVSLAAVNTPGMCTVGGPLAAINKVRSSLEARGVQCHPLHTSHAFHSSMMDEVIARYAEHVSKCPLSVPRIPFLSNRTGKWILPEEATSVAYWLGHLRETVRFADGIRELASNPSRVFIEVGPGQALTILARECLGGLQQGEVLATLPHPQDPRPEQEHILSTVGKLWLSGVTIDWEGHHQGETIHRVPLPTYPFESKKYWVEPQPDVSMSTQPVSSQEQTVRSNIEDWFYFPSWRRSALPTSVVSAENYGPWLIFVDDSGLGDAIIEALTSRRESIVSVRRGASFSRRGEREFTVDPSQAADFEAMFDEMSIRGIYPRSVLYLWSLGSSRRYDARSEFHDLLLVARMIGSRVIGSRIDLIVVSSGMHRINGNEVVTPETSLLLGPCKVLPCEFPHLFCRSIDLAADEVHGAMIQEMIMEPGMPHSSRAVAYRAGYRWEQTFEPAILPSRTVRQLREHGVYLITGGMGGIGLTLARHLAETTRARIALVGQTPLPDRPLWPQWIKTHEADNETSKRIRELERIEAFGGKVLPVVADVCDPESMRQAIRLIRDQFGPINGAIHAAGIVDPGLAELKTRAAADRVLNPKVEGTLILDSLLRDEPLDFLMLFSSINAIYGFAGSIDYTAANCFLDAFALSCFKGAPATVISINWDAWRDVGMAVKGLPVNDVTQEYRREFDKFAIHPSEGIEAFRRVLASGLPQVAVITRDLRHQLDEPGNLLASSASFSGLTPESRPHSTVDALHARPNLSSDYVAHETDTQKLMTEIWTESLGIGGIGIDDNFFALGGHSLLATSVLSRVRNSFHIAIPLRAIFDAPTIRLLSEYLDTLMWATFRSKASREELEGREEIEL
ncbi:MAG TPA: beta-ketoacyl synthase N-terminal-like domain-containing protein [Terracidiphilus sp.]|jgi:acyl transferase domain-containing protein